METQDVVFPYLCGFTLDVLKVAERTHWHHRPHQVWPGDEEVNCGKLEWRNSRGFIASFKHLCYFVINDKRRSRFWAVRIPYAVEVSHSTSWYCTDIPLVPICIPPQSAAPQLLCGEKIKAPWSTGAPEFGPNFRIRHSALVSHRRALLRWSHHLRQTESLRLI